MTKLLHHVYFKDIELIYAFRAEILNSFFKKPALSLPPLPTGGTKISPQKMKDPPLAKLTNLTYAQNMLHCGNMSQKVEVKASPLNQNTK